MRRPKGYIVVKEDGEAYAVASLSGRGVLSPLNPRRRVDQVPDHVEASRAYFVAVENEERILEPTPKPNALLLAPRAAPALQPISIQRRHTDLMGGTTSALGAFARVDTGTTFFENGKAPEDGQKGGSDSLLLLSDSWQRWTTALGRRHSRTDDLGRLVEHSWRGVRPDLLYYDDGWLDLRSGVDGLIPIVRYEAANAEARDLGTLLLLGPIDGVQPPIDYLDRRAPETLEADLKVLAGELIALETSDKNAAEALRHLFKNSVDPRLVARLRAAANQSNGRGLTGRLLEWTLERAGWAEVERRSIDNAEKQLADRLEERGRTILARIDARLGMLPVERTIAEGEEVETSTAATLEEMEDRLLGLAEGIEESLVAKFADFAASRDASRRKVLKELREEIEGLRSLPERVELPEAASGSPETDDAPDPDPEAELLHEPAARYDALRDAAVRGGLAPEPLAMIAALCRSGYLPILSSGCAADVAFTLASAAGGGRLFRIDCDPTLVTIADVEERLHVARFHDARDDGQVVVLLHHLNLSPTVYWFDALLDDLLRHARGTLVVASVAEHPFRHGLTRPQLLRTAPLDIARRVRSTPTQSRPTRFPIAPSSAGGQSAIAPSDVPFVASAEHAARMGEIASNSRALFGSGIASADMKVYVESLVDWWTSLEEEQSRPKGIGALLVGEGSWS